MADPLHYGLIEAGGTKFMLGIADADGAIGAVERIDTRKPEETLGEAIAWFAAQPQKLAAIGIATFGPIDLDTASPTWGHIKLTAKPYWTGTDMVGPFAREFACPVGIATDVDGAALAEARWGAGRGAVSTLYVTVGTGIGGGLVTEHGLLHGLSHPEMGHIAMPRHPDDREFAGICRIHHYCFEGLACGPAIKARWGASLSELPADHRAHAIVAWYLGRAVATYQAIMEPGCIVLGGGVMATPGLIERVRVEAVAANAGYFTGDPMTIVVPPGLGTRSGLTGALALAQDDSHKA